MLTVCKWHEATVVIYGDEVFLILELKQVHCDLAPWSQHWFLTLFWSVRAADCTLDYVISNFFIHPRPVHIVTSSA